MTPANRTTEELVNEALFHLELALSYSQRDLSDTLTLDALALRLAAGIDAVGALPVDLRTKVVGDEWPAVRGMRNRIAHGYLVVSPDLLRMTAQQDLPVLVAALRAARNQVGEHQAGQTGSRQ